MASGLTRFGNDLYTGERSVPFIRLRTIWLTIRTLTYRQIGNNNEW